MTARILVVSTADTDLLAAAHSRSQLPERFPHVIVAPPAALEGAAALHAALSQVAIVVVRLLGGIRAWPEGFADLRAACREQHIALVAFGGEDGLDPELTEQSTVPATVVSDAFEYVRHGGVDNTAHLLRFLADTVLLEGFGFAPPQAVPRTGYYQWRRPANESPDTSTDEDRRSRRHEPRGAAWSIGNAPTPDQSKPSVGVVFYRAHWLAGNTAFVDVLCAALEDAGARPVPVFAYSLRPESDGRTPALDLLAGDVDALIVTVLASGGAGAADALAGAGSERPEGWFDWHADALEALDVPVVQGICATVPEAHWREGQGLVPMDMAMQVAIPEFDGRIIGVAFSFKEPLVAGPVAASGASLNATSDGAGGTAPALSPTAGEPTTGRAAPAASGLSAYRADPERSARLAQLATRLGSLRRTPVATKRIGIMLSSYPTKHARLGNAVALDTPASAIVLLQALAGAGYDVGAPPAGGDELIHRLIAAGGHDTEFLTDEQLAAAWARVAPETYARWFATLPEGLRQRVCAQWGEPPGDLYVGADGAIVVTALRFGNIVVAVQPPRGFGDNPVAIYHDPELPPSHHYLAAYWWLTHEFKVDALIHLGKHGTLEWLPGKSVGLSAECAPDAALGAVPLIYPFVVNDPGEGTQAKRRSHAIIVDHLIAPMMRADTYDELARLEQLLDEHAHVQALDPTKLPALRAEIWQLIRAAELHRDLGVADTPEADGFDEFLLHVDGYLCELKDLRVRDGLHILGAPPQGEQLLGLLLAILRLGAGEIPGLRRAVGAAFGFDEPALVSAPGTTARAAFVVDDPISAQPEPDIEVHVEAAVGMTAETERQGEDADVQAREAAERSAEGRIEPANPDAVHELLDQRELAGPEVDLQELLARFPGPGHTGSDILDRLEEASRALLVDLAAREWDLRAVDAAVLSVLGRRDAGVSAALAYAAGEVVPRLARTSDEISAILGALDGHFVPAGPAGSPTRGLVNVLPTGRNFYSVDPRALPSELAWATGVRLAEDLLARELAEQGRYPAVVGIVVWGTAAMRTQGDDIAEVLWLLGVRPQWQPESRRIVGLDVVPLAELGRPRIDVSVRISGFFRDAFPGLIALMDQAVELVAGLDEPAEDNFVAAHVGSDCAQGVSRREATTRIFGSKPGAYGAGLLPLIDARNWHDDADLARVYEVWGGYAYGRDLPGIEATEAMRRSYRRIGVAVKNADTREHDLLDSDDYFQYHGGMIAAVRALTGTNPRAYIGDSSDPVRVRNRTLAEETRRVVRARVLNPRWIASMARHGYKGAFELAATVDYLFGYDATTGVVEDWMYAAVTERYLIEEQTVAFLRQSNPWAARAIAERLLEAVDRKLWEAPDPELLSALRDRYLELDGDLEDGAGAPVGP